MQRFKGKPFLGLFTEPLICYTVWLFYTVVFKEIVLEHFFDN